MKLMVILLVFGMVVSAAQAIEILVQPTGATASHQQSSSPAGKLIDGSGLSDASIVETGDAVPATYPSHGTNASDMWRTLKPSDGQPIVGATVQFELGDSCDLSGFHLWNYNEYWSGGESNRGIKIATVEYSTNNGTNWTSLGDMTFAQATGLSNYTGEDYTFASPLIGVTDVRFTVVENHGGDRVGLSEVRFIETDALSGAHTPDPSRGEVNVEVDLLDRVVPGAVSWAAPTDPNIATVFGYNMYLDPNETKVLNATPASTDLEFKSLQSGGQTGTSFDPGADLAYQTPYYWRVDAIVDFDYIPGDTINDANTVTGGIWSFTTIGEQALVTPVSPALTAVDAGESNVVLSVIGTNATTYQWYKEGVGILSNGADYDGVTTGTLTIFDVRLADEGYYYCQVDNDLPGTEPVDSVPGRVMTRRLIIHYPLDTVDSNVTPDVVGGFDMTLAKNTATLGYPTLITDPNVKIGAGALRFANPVSTDPNYYGQYATAGDVDLEDMGIGFTVEFWMNWAGSNGTTDGVIVRRNAWAADQMRWGIEQNPTKGLYFAAYPNASPTPATVQTAQNAWVHVAVTHNGVSTARVYINGEFEAQHTGVSYGTGVNSPLMLAASNFDSGTGQANNFFNGMLDDIKFYNYVRTTAQIAQDYLAINGGWVCDNEGTEDLTLDFDKNCQVDLDDFLVLAEDWLNSNRIYPN
jgi:hypothetical protein